MSAEAIAYPAIPPARTIGNDRDGATTSAPAVAPSTGTKAARGFAWVADDVLAPIVWSAAELLTSGLLERVRECTGDDDTCGWLFLDTSRNGSRRWCDMRTCGNRAKAKRYYRRAANSRS